MKKAFIYCVLCTLISSVSAQIAEDKLKHFGAGVVIGGVGGYAAHKIFNGSPGWTWAGAVGSSVAAGLVKESMDQSKYGGWDNNDIVFTALGGIVSGIALQLFTKGGFGSGGGENWRRGGGGRYSFNKNKISNQPDFEFVFIEGSHDLKASMQAQSVMWQLSLEPANGFNSH